MESERFAFEDSSNNTGWYLRNSWLWTFPKYPIVDGVGEVDGGVLSERADDMLDDNIFFLIKMPLESEEISRVNVEGDNINLTAADVDSFDVAVWSASEMKESEGRKEAGDVRDVI